MRVELFYKISNRLLILRHCYHNKKYLMLMLYTYGKNKKRIYSDFFSSCKNGVLHINTQGRVLFYCEVLSVEMEFPKQD